jgi:hypothetical protein
MLSGLRFRYRRWASVRQASAGLGAASPSERELIDELRSGCRALPVADASRGTPNEVDWATATNRLRHLVLHADPRAFLRWDVIVERMAVRHSPMTSIELAALQARPDWEARWRRAIRECDAGHPFRYAGWPESSEPLIQTAYTLARLETLAGRPVAEWDAVVEFGGGFGSLCRLMHQLGFRGRYVIFDLAPFTLLQRYWLRSAGVLRDDDRIALTSDLAELERLVAAVPPDAWSMFVACWSLSETPLALRERLRPLVERVGRYAVVYQEQYGEVDNVDYFTNRWLAGPRHTQRLVHRAGDHLLVGGAPWTSSRVIPSAVEGSAPLPRLV